MINQLLGPVFNLIGDGGFGAWRIGTWFVLKYANLVMFVVVAALFGLGLVLNFPDRTEGPLGNDDKSRPVRSGQDT